jgi:hypothetical protein
MAIDDGECSEDLPPRRNWQSLIERTAAAAAPATAPSASQSSSLLNGVVVVIVIAAPGRSEVTW